MASTPWDIPPKMLSCKKSDPPLCIPHTPSSRFGEAVPADVTQLADLFWASLNAHPAYISHSEIQTGIALDCGVPAPDGRIKWEKYLLGKITHPHSRVLIAEQEHTLGGFVVQSLNTDYDRTFGVIDDLLVAASLRGSGLGGELLEAGHRLASQPRSL